MVFVEDRLALAGSAKYYADPDKVQICKYTMIFIYNNWFEKCVYVKWGVTNRWILHYKLHCYEPTNRSKGALFATLNSKWQK